MREPHPPSSGRVKQGALETIVVTGICVGIIDGVAAVALTMARSGRSPLIVFQYIASGILGNAAFSGGMASVILGMACHFFIALSWSAVFFFLQPATSRFIKGKVGKSILYGVIIWIVMNLLVLPLSAVDQGTFRATKIFTGAGILIVAAGLPMAYFFDRYYIARSGRIS
jgi:hypothetical protein